MDEIKLKKLKEQIDTLEKIDYLGYDTIDEMESALKQSEYYGKKVEDSFAIIIYLRELGENHNVKINVNGRELILEDEDAFIAINNLLESQKKSYEYYKDEYENI
jgi:phenolic acid decarboxylase